MSSDAETNLSDEADAGDLRQFGYAQSLRRTLGPYGSFAIAFSMIRTTAIFFLLPSLFGTAGAAGVWLWIPCAAAVFLIALMYAYLGARIPITGFAYQWNSRLINPHYGWFTATPRCWPSWQARQPRQSRWRPYSPAMPPPLVRRVPRALWRTPGNAC
jgi:hypothetical protein